MDIFYLKKSDFLPFIKQDCLLNFSDGRKFDSEDKKLEHLLGVFLTKLVAKNIFNVKNTNIEIVGRKPYFKTREIYFNISHSKDIVLVAFDTENVGTDIEFIKKRDFSSLFKRYSKDTTNPTAEQFYDFWTYKEAEYKLGETVQTKLSEIIEKEYMLCIASKKTQISDYTIQKLICKSKNINLSDEYKNLSKIEFCILK